MRALSSLRSFINILYLSFLFYLVAPCSPFLVACWPTRRGLKAPGRCFALITDPSEAWQDRNPRVLEDFNFTQK